jgi:SHS2 domain-containing protein
MTGDARGRYELRDHTADVAVHAEGGTLGATFAAAAQGLTAAMCDDVPEGGDRYDVAVHSENREALLFDYLDELVYRRDVEGVLPTDHEAAVHFSDEWILAGSFRGVPFDEVVARDVKAVTYSDMRVAETDDGWEAYVVLDV